MITLITGTINQGKTRRIQALYHRDKKGDGFVCTKRLRNSRMPEYDILRLKTGEQHPFAYDRQHLPAEWVAGDNWGRFSFSAEGLAFAEQVITNIIREKIQPVYIDEIGPLEIIEGRGFNQLFKRVIRLNRDVFATVRSEFKNALIRKYGITDYDEIHV